MATDNRGDGDEARHEPIGLPKERSESTPTRPSGSRHSRRRRRACGGSWEIGRAIEHVGSTAVPGLDAKPIVDIMIGTGNLDDAYDLIPVLERTGYRYLRRFDAVPRLFLVKGTAQRGTHHLHLTPYGGHEWAKMLLFRDELRAHPDIAAAYAALKHDLARRHPTDRDAYVEGKEAFIAVVRERAEIERRRSSDERSGTQ